MTEQRARRVLIITRNLPPLVGGMERLNWHMASELSKIAEVRVVGPQGSAILAPEGIEVVEVPLKPVGVFLAVALRQARHVASHWKPDVILAGSGLTAPVVWWAARSCRAKTAVYAHGLDVAIKQPVYRNIWIPAIRCMGSVIANSSSTAALCRDVGVASTRVAIIHPGVELPQGLSDALKTRNARDAFRERHRLGERPVLLSVGRLSARKGLREFVSEALPKIVAAHPDAILLIIGDAPSQALRASAQSHESIQAAADAAGVGCNLRFLGKVTDEELSAAYNAAEVHVFPVRDIPGDPEGFGMVAIEAAANGLPTVAFGAGGVVDAVSEGKSGHLVPPGDYSALAAAVNNLLDRGMDMRRSCMSFAARFAWPRFADALSEILELNRARPATIREAGDD